MKPFVKGFLRKQQALYVSVLFIAIAGAMEGMLKIEGTNVGLIFILDRVCFDLLCRNKSCLGKEIKGSEYAAGCIACNFSGICTVGVLKIIRVFEVRRKGYYQGETT